MGIFTDPRDEDVAAIYNILHASLRKYGDLRANSPTTVGFEVRFNDNANLEFISDAGGRILKKFASEPTALQRIAALVVVCASSTLFSLRRNGKPCTDINAGKEFRARFYCIAIQAALAILDLPAGAPRLVWDRFPDDYFQEQFVTYLEWVGPPPLIPGAEKNPKAAKDAQDAYEKILAHLTLGCAMALSCCVKETASQAAVLLPPPTPPALDK